MKKKVTKVKECVTPLQNINVLNNLNHVLNINEITEIERVTLDDGSMVVYFKNEDESKKMYWLNLSRNKVSFNIIDEFLYVNYDITASEITYDKIKLDDTILYEEGMMTKGVSDDTYSNSRTSYVFDYSSLLRAGIDAYDDEFATLPNPVKTLMAIKKDNSIVKYSFSTRSTYDVYTMVESHSVIKKLLDSEIDSKEYKKLLRK